MNADVLTNTIDCGEVRFDFCNWMDQEFIRLGFTKSIDMAGMSFGRGETKDEYVLIAATGDAIRIMESLPNYVIETPVQDGDFVRRGHLEGRPVLSGPVPFTQVVLVTPDQTKRSTFRMYFDGV